MKTIKLFILISFTLFVTKGISQNNSVKTVTFTVYGVCGDCKERIENAADIKGVKKCTWNKETKVATVILDEKKISQADVEKAISKAGYSTQNEKADPKAYKKLPDCCQYTEDSKTH
jgi:periplasmic mercuric ion binding protein